ncbi:hypothetical protein TNCV_3475331 [Trichonephila clavipes]|nr:hypothetical protein TNCV_3475331 [Trichonephila clavipes]
MDERQSQPCPARGLNLEPVAWKRDVLTTQPVMVTPSISTSAIYAWNWMGGKYSPAPALVVSAATAHKTFGPTDLTSTYSEGIWWHRTQVFRSGVRCSNH